MAVMKSPGHEFGACLWDHQANLAVQQAKLDCFVYRLALLWLRVTHKSWQPEQRTKLSLGKGLLAGGGHMTWALLSTSHPGGVGVLELGGWDSFIFLPALEEGVWVPCLCLEGFGGAGRFCRAVTYLMA